MMTVFNIIHILKVILPYNFPYIADHVHQLYRFSTAMQVLSLGKFVRGLRVGELVVGLRPPEATPGAGNPLVGPMFFQFDVKRSPCQQSTQFFDVSGRYRKVELIIMYQEGMGEAELSELMITVIPIG